MYDIAQQCDMGREGFVVICNHQAVQALTNRVRKGSQARLCLAPGPEHACTVKAAATIERPVKSSRVNCKEHLRNATRRLFFQGPEKGQRQVQVIGVYRA